MTAYTGYSNPHSGTNLVFQQTLSPDAIGSDSEPNEPGPPAHIVIDPPTGQTGEFRVSWFVTQYETNSGQIAAMASGDEDFRKFVDSVTELLSLRRRRQEWLAAVNLDPQALKMLNKLDRATSIPWKDVQKEVELDWSDTCRAIALLANAALCDAGVSRLRLSARGDQLLAGMSSVPID